MFYIQVLAGNPPPAKYGPFGEQRNAVEALKNRGWSPSRQGTEIVWRHSKARQLLATIRRIDLPMTNPNELPGGEQEQEPV